MDLTLPMRPVCIISLAALHDNKQRLDKVSLYKAHRTTSTSAISLHTTTLRSTADNNGWSVGSFGALNFYRR